MRKDKQPKLEPVKIGTLQQRLGHGTALPLPKPYADFCEHLHGAHPGPFHRAEGVALDAPVAVFHFGPDKWQLAVKLGGDWFSVARLALGEPAIEALRSTGALSVLGPAPHDTVKEKRREAERQEAIDRQEAYQQSRRDLATQRVQAAEAAQREHTQSTARQYSMEE